MTGRLAVVAMLIVLAALASLTRGGAGHERAAGSLEQSRAGMVAGCRDQGARRSYCECVADEVLERNGRDLARLRAMEVELRRLRPGSPPPRLLVKAGRACATA